MDTLRWSKHFAHGKQGPLTSFLVEIVKTQYKYRHETPESIPSQFTFTSVLNQSGAQGNKIIHRFHSVNVIFSAGEIKMARRGRVHTNSDDKHLYVAVLQRPDSRV